MAAADLIEPESAQRFGRTVDADYIVLVDLSEGAALEASVAVMDVASAEAVWGADFRRSPDAPAVLAADIAAALASALDIAPPAPPPAPRGPPPTLAVLDFRGDGPATDLNRHLSGLADLLSADLTGLGVPLVERRRLSSVLDELGLSASGLVRAASMAQAGRLLGAQRVLDTSMMALPAGVILDSQLVHPESGAVVGTCRVSGHRDELPSLVEQLAVGVAEVLRVPVTEAGCSNLAQRQTASLEAALKAAAGWRLGEAGMAEEAILEYQQAVYLDPEVAAWWRELGEQYRAVDDEANWAESLRRFFPAAGGKADRATLARMAVALAEAETLRRRHAEAEAAARLALQYDEHPDAYCYLISSLVAQHRLAEALALCHSLTHRADLSHEYVVSFWSILTGRIVHLQPKGEEALHALHLVSCALDFFTDGDEEADIYLAACVHNAIVASCNLHRPDWLKPDNPVQHAEVGLALARRMASYQRSLRVASRGWFLVGLLSYKVGRAQDALAALTRCVEDYPTAICDVDAEGGTGAAQGLVYYLLGRVHQDLMEDRDAAVEAYQKMLYLLAAGRAESHDARARLSALGGEELPPAPWLRRVGGAGQDLESAYREQLLVWLRGQQYDLRLQTAPLEQQLLQQGIQILMWEGRTADFPPADVLRTYVAGGGNVLVLMSASRFGDYFGYHGGLLATSSETLDPSLNWLLPAFGLSMSTRPFHVRSAALVPAPADIGLLLDSPRYSGPLFHVSATATGRAGNARSHLPSISGDGRYVAFASKTSNLVGGDTNGQEDVLVRDMVAATTERVSVGSEGQQLVGPSTSPSIGGDSRCVAFQLGDAMGFGTSTPTAAG